MADAAKLVIDGESYDLSTDLTLEEVEEIEELADAPLNEIDLSRVKYLKRVVFFLQRKKNPDLSLEDVGKQPLSVLQAEDDGDQGNSEDAPKPSGRKKDA